MIPIISKNIFYSLFPVHMTCVFLYIPYDMHKSDPPSFKAFYPLTAPAAIPPYTCFWKIKNRIKIGIMVIITPAQI